MSNVFEFQGYVQLFAILALLLVKVYAFANALSWTKEAYDAAGKLTKPAWLVILGIGLAAQILMLNQPPIGLISLAFTIAAFVYILDVRPALRSVTGRR